MSETEIRQKKATIEAEYGPWTAYNLRLGHGVETAPQFACAHLRLRRVTQAIADLSRKPWSELRILDLGSLEGIFALEFASRGARVLGIEGRESNNAKARFAAEALGLPNAEFVADDVRNISPEKYGLFDVVLCSGILYHLPEADTCRFLEAIHKVCKHLAIIDTHVGIRPDASVSWKGRKYFGVLTWEHAPSDSEAQKSERKWASLDNNTSFWFTKISLLNVLRDVGFTTVCEIFRPASFADFSDRITLAALKGQAKDFSVCEELNTAREPDFPELSTLKPNPAQMLPEKRPLWRRIGSKVRRMFSHLL